MYKAVILCVVLVAGARGEWLESVVDTAKEFLGDAGDYFVDKYHNAKDLFEDIKDKHVRRGMQGDVVLCTAVVWKQGR